MKRLLLLLLLLPTLAQASGPWTETQALTRADPPADTPPNAVATFPTPPMNLVDTRRYRLTVCAVSPATLSGTGKIRTWLWHNKLQRWGFNPTNDVSVTSTAACQSWGITVDVRVGHILPAAQAVGVSSGTTVNLYVDTDNQP